MKLFDLLWCDVFDLWLNQLTHFLLDTHCRQQLGDSRLQLLRIHTIKPIINLWPRFLLRELIG